MNQHQPVSIVVPTLNEAENIPLLLERIDNSMQATGTTYEVLVIDDHSTDNTVAEVVRLSDHFPVRAQLKQGKRGKAFSLLEGFDQAQYPLTAMIDADLQYAPEELSAMYNLLIEKDADMVITDRQERKTSLLRKLMTKVYNFIFARLLFGIKFDTQSGLKLFKRDVLDNITMDPSPWTFDLEFLVRALENKRKIISHTIEFGERNAGVTKIKIVSSTLEMIRASLKLRWRTSLRKTREGYRANDRFLKRAFGTFTVLLCVFSLTTAFSPKISASALPSASILSSLKHLFGNSSGAGDGTATSNSGTHNTQATSTDTVSQGGDTAAAQTVPVNTLTTADSIPAATADSSQSGKLGAATAAKQQDNVYDSGYPNYKLSSARSHKWSRIAATALETGVVCLGIAAAAFMRRSVRLHNYYRSLRSTT